MHTKQIKVRADEYARFAEVRERMALARGGRVTFGQVFMAGLGESVKSLPAIEDMQDVAARAVVALAKMRAVGWVLAHRRIEGVLTPDAAWHQLPPIQRRALIAEALPDIEDVTVWAAVSMRAYRIGDATALAGDRDHEWTAPVFDSEGNRIGERRMFHTSEETQ